MDRSRVEAMIAAFEAGFGIRRTARELSAGRTTVTRWFRRWKAARHGEVVIVAIASGSAGRLAVHAAARGISLAELVSRLAEEAADGGLVDVVLGSLEIPGSR